LNRNDKSISNDIESTISSLFMGIFRGSRIVFNRSVWLNRHRGSLVIPSILFIAIFIAIVIFVFQLSCIFSSGYCQNLYHAIYDLNNDVDGKTIADDVFNQNTANLQIEDSDEVDKGTEKRSGINKVSEVVENCGLNISNNESKQIVECFNNYFNSNMYSDAFLCIESANIYADINYGDENDIDKGMVIRQNGANWDDENNIVITGHRINLSQPNHKTLLNLDDVESGDKILVLRTLPKEKLEETAFENQKVTEKKSANESYDNIHNDEVLNINNTTVCKAEDLISDRKNNDNDDLSSDGKQAFIIYEYSVNIIDEVLPQEVQIESIISPYLYTSGGIYNERKSTITIYTCTPLWVFNRRLVVFGILENKYHLLL